MFVSLWLAACTGPATPPAGQPAEPGGTGPHALVVEGGFGGGFPEVGASVRVWADVDPQREIAAGWGQDEALLDTPAEWNASLVMPDREVRLQVARQAVPTPIESRAVSLPGGERQLRVVEADAPVGAVLFFHGAAYSVDNLADNAARTVVMHLVRAGWTVVALESEAEARSGTGGWSADLDEASNPDLQNARALVALLRSEGTLPASAPVAAWGMSSGGYFAHAVGAVGIAQIVLAHCSAGHADALALTEAPTGWYLAGADTVLSSSVDDAQSFQEALEARGIPTDLYVHPQTPLYDQRFIRVSGIDLAQSAEIAQALRDQGAVDARGAWLLSGAQIDAPDLSGALSGQALSAVKAEIEIMAADHELYDDAASRMVAFLQSQLAASP